MDIKNPKEYTKKIIINKWVQQDYKVQDQNQGTRKKSTAFPHSSKEQSKNNF